MLFPLLAGGVLVASISLFLVLRRRTSASGSAPATFLWVDMYYKPTPQTNGWLQTHVLLPLGVRESEIDSAALTLAAAQLHHAGQQVAELRVQYIGGRRCAWRYIGNV